MMQESPITRRYEAAEHFTALAARADSIAERIREGKMDEQAVARLVRVCADTIQRLTKAEADEKGNR